MSTTLQTPFNTAEGDYSETRRNILSGGRKEDASGISNVAGVIVVGVRLGVLYGIWEDNFAWEESAKDVAGIEGSGIDGWPG